MTEIAEAVGCPLKTAYARLYAARRVVPRAALRRAMAGRRVKYERARRARAPSSIRPQTRPTACATSSARGSEGSPIPTSWRASRPASRSAGSRLPARHLLRARRRGLPSSGSRPPRPLPRSRAPSPVPSSRPRRPPRRQRPPRLQRHAGPARRRIPLACRDERRASGHGDRRGPRRGSAPRRATPRGSPASNPTIPRAPACRVRPPPRPVADRLPPRAPTRRRAETPSPTASDAPPLGASPGAGEAADPESEVHLLQRAQGALGADPGAALAPDRRAHARRFPGGALAQERELIAVTALVALGPQTGGAGPREEPPGAIPQLGVPRAARIARPRRPLQNNASVSPPTP